MEFVKPYLTQKKIIMTVLCASTLWLSGCTQTAKKHSTAPPNLISIQYEKYTLDNGLTVIIHPDHSDPITHIDVTYHVGSAREELGRSGFAHLFEHMMFQGSENVADEEHFKIITAAGGTMNGTTNRDRTNYYQTVPSNNLEKVLWLEADRMGFFLNGITQEKFEIQRATVKNEKQQNYDNRAYGRYSELNTKALYPSSHPYSWLTIGDLEDLDSATAEDLRNFFLRWYGPNNATLTIAGDINKNELKPLIEKYFGSIPSGPDVTAQTYPIVTLEANRYISYYDDNIRFPALTFTFPTVPKFHPDAAALSCLGTILGQGKGSYLYQNFIDSKKAISASAYNNSDELAGEFFMFVLPFPGQSLNQFEMELKASLDDFERNGVSQDDLDKFKIAYETSYINKLESVSGKASELAYYETFANTPEKLHDELVAHLAITKEDVMRVYTKYIKNKPAVILSILANKEGIPTQPDNFTITKASTPSTLEKTENTLKIRVAKDNFDRSVQPPAEKSKLATPPKFWKHTTKKGYQLLGAEQHDLPMVNISIRLKGGNTLDQLPHEKLGIAALTMEMMNTSTINYSEQAIAEELEKIGSSIHFSSSDLYFNIQINTLSKYFDRTFELLQEKISHPAFHEKDFSKIKQQTLESIKSSTQQATSIANSVWLRTLYGEKHLKGTPSTQAIPSIESLTANELKNFHQKYFNFKNSEWVAVGNFNKKDLLNKLNNFSANITEEIEYPTQPPITPHPSTSIYLVDKPNAEQSEIRIGYASDLPYDASGEYYKRSLMNFNLGGAFNSRINLNLREDKGITYGARAYFSGTELPGHFEVSTSVKQAGTALAISEIIREINDFIKKGITTEELIFLRQAIGQRDALKYESYQQKARFLSAIQRFNIDPNFTNDRKQIIENISKEEINALAKKHLPIDDMIILIVGDKQKIISSLKTLNYPIIELTTTGELKE